MHDKSNLNNMKTEDDECLLWVDKYKPKSMNKIIGQQTDKSNAKKLHYWLQNWHKWHDASKEKVSKGNFFRSEDGSHFKAALLSGGPGIGKTTTAQLVASDLGFTYIEMNASDARSKKLIDNVLGGTANNFSIESYNNNNKHKSTLASDKHCIIMDEVDGMAGNEDRGGIQELINNIKTSKIPIICICNDRQHVKIRSLANHCFDLRFYKPKVEQIRSALMTICCRENIKISSDLLDQIIVGANFDIRQCIHNLSMWTSNKKTLTSEKTKIDIEKAIKDTKINPFEACKDIFNIDSTKTSLFDKMDLFFCDYGLMPLLVQENYLNVSPSNVKKNSLQYLNALSDSIESICEGDRISRILRSGQNWSLLPTQAIFSTVVPGDKLSGHIGLSNFPLWFGKNSKQGRVDRILQELQKHMRLKISANKHAVGMDYLSIFKDRLTRPLIVDGSNGVEKTLHLMNDYYLTREDFDTILELSTWPGQVDLLTKIDSKVKAAFTRAYNKESHKNPFSIIDFKKIKGKKGGGGENEEIFDEQEENVQESEEEDDDISSDAMIKAVNKTSKLKSTATTKSAAAKTTAAKAKLTAKRPAAESTTSKTPASKKKKT